MEIKDKEGNLLASYIKSEKNIISKNFHTSNDQELQVASFNLKKGEEIIRHYHPANLRKIKTTSEVIVLKKGTLNIDIYDKNQNYVDSFELKDGDIGILISGGHGLHASNDCVFIEVKQGPYDEATDKIRF